MSVEHTMSITSSSNATPPDTAARYISFTVCAVGVIVVAVPAILCDGAVERIAADVVVWLDVAIMVK